MVETGNRQRVLLAPSMRLQWDPARQVHVLLYPQGTAQLNESAAVILQLCDGSHSSNDIVRELSNRFDAATLAADVREFLGVARGHGWIVDA